MSTNHGRRLDDIAKRVLPKCRTCYGYPVRIVGIDDDTDADTSESMPASGCPECGRPEYSELRIVGLDATEL